MIASVLVKVGRSWGGMRKMRVIQKEARLWQVVELGEILAEFSTSEAAWKWVDWHSFVSCVISRNAGAARMGICGMTIVQAHFLSVRT